MSEHTGLEFAPPIVAFPKFTLDAPSSVIYNLYVQNQLASANVKIRHVFCDTFSWRAAHRDYKRIEAAPGDEPRNKLNKSNGGQI